MKNNAYPSCFSSSLFFPSGFLILKKKSINNMNACQHLFTVQKNREDFNCLLFLVALIKVILTMLCGENCYYFCKDIKAIV